jgi:hypothetical protein
VISVLSGPIIAVLVHLSPDDPVSNIYGLPRYTVQTVGKSVTKLYINCRSTLYVFCILFKNSNVDNEALPTMAAPKIYLTVWWVFW